MRIFRALLLPHAHMEGVQLSVAHPVLFQSTLFRLKLQETPEAEGMRDHFQGKTELERINL